MLQLMIILHFFQVDSNKMFVMLEFENAVEQSIGEPKNKLKINLNPCIYKKR